MQHVDVLIIGAGISGIGAGCHLTSKCPDRTFLILENRHALGGTWDLFRYPGVRADSDMFTYGYSFKPWNKACEIARGEAINDYLNETAEQFELKDKIRFQHQVTRLDWSSEKKLWTVSISNHATGDQLSVTSQFVMNCTGYYNFESAHQPALPGQENFTGPIIHPQFWPQDLSYANKRVVVIGSGATAVTIVPAMAETAAHVTMLQRTPGFVLSRPAQDPLVSQLRRWLPDKLVWRIKRTKSLVLGSYFYARCRRQPEKMRGALVSMAREQLGDSADPAIHFNPPYKPWDQRLCLSPDGDLFEAIRNGKATVVTEHIDGLENDGIRLRSGNHLPADIVISATGLAMRFLGGASAYSDGHPIDVKDLVNFRGTLFGNMPNFASIFGYANASWTLKADLSCDYFCRLLNTMRRKGFRVATPDPPPADLPLQPMLNLNAGYVQRSQHAFPSYRLKSPWRNFDYYFQDYLSIRWGRLKPIALKLQ
ncbi:MAG: NAD(P)/FAD-dependent oxidoreductase [Burkholderiaceae bacterium]